MVKASERLECAQVLLQNLNELAKLPRLFLEIPRLLGKTKLCIKKSVKDSIIFLSFQNS